MRLVRYHGADVHKLRTDSWKTRTALHIAAPKGQTKIIHALVREFGVDANAKDSYESTPLYSAASNGHTETARVLVKELGATVNAVDINGNTPCTMLRPMDTPTPSASSSRSSALM